MMGFRRLTDLAERRPLLIGAVGCGLAAEAGRVLWGLMHDPSVVLLGHDGATRWSVVEDTTALQAYAAWITACALVLIGLPAWYALKRRARRNEALADTRPAASTVVVRTRDLVEKKRA